MDMNMTIAEFILKSLPNFTGDDKDKSFNDLFKDKIGEYVVVRTYSAGVFYGTLKNVDPDILILDKARRIWNWNGANSLSDVALYGVKDKDNTRICAPIDSHIINKWIEIIPMTEEAIKNLNKVKNWSKNEE